MKIPKELLYPAPFYNFLNYISETDINGPILDCGSGGPSPKQALFVLLGFDTIGIENSEERLQMAQDYAKQNKLDLHMRIGDMRSIPFESDYFGHVYSWNTIFHMNKIDIKKGVNEMIRVLKPGGLCFVNFLSLDSEFSNEGEEQNPGEYLQIEGDEEIRHTFFTDEESDGFFDDLEIEILYKEKRIFKKKFDERVMQDAYFDYIVRKKKS
ncbi:MAG: class I SAM-dependent methyltransferase [Promethearchaeota archaeon]|nr:MAG: class I SAM-dependent methyltransferase [Candidatus Lokiarchaeota archaeon]